MIIGNDRLKVIDNIRRLTKEGDLNSKVEIGDPVLSAKEQKAITDRYLRKRGSMPFRLKALIARSIANSVTEKINCDTETVGVENAESIEGGAIITSNHFSPLENTVIRKYALSRGKNSLCVVSNVTNFAMKGIIGFLMNYGDTVPLSENARYMCRDFCRILSEKLENNEYVLIYPEQEMWFNYRKIRPLKRGAYFYAAKLGVPVISCFVEMRDLPEKDTEEFYKVKYVLHVLGVIYPDKEKNARENSFIMRDADFSLKKAAYERIYGKELDYTFEPSDIAGWITNAKGEED